VPARQAIGCGHHRHPLTTTCGSLRQPSIGARGGDEPSESPKRDRSHRRVRPQSREFPTLILNLQGDDPSWNQHCSIASLTTAAIARSTSLPPRHPFERRRKPSSPHQVKVIVDRNGNALYFFALRSPPLALFRPRPNICGHQGVFTVFAAKAA